MTASRQHSKNKVNATAVIDTRSALLSDLVRMNDPDAVLAEVRCILSVIDDRFDDDLVDRAFELTINLFRGHYPGYRECNTEYHNLRHTTDTFLTTARLAHGAIIDGERFTNRRVSLALTAALLHDAGYIQEIDDIEGTGAKHTLDHVQRSMQFMEKAAGDLGLSEDEVSDGAAMIFCTEIAEELTDFDSEDPQILLLGKILGAADLLAQLADRTYLEKLLFLYREFKEANVGGYENERDLLRRTVGFYDAIVIRLDKTLSGADRFVNSHFSQRWGIDRNLYKEAIENQKLYLKKILAIPDTDHRDFLKRNGIVEKVRKKYRTPH
ncbi:MAG: HD domain-containing protein [Desulfobacterales bacterium]|nr:HD domain-containing protein [Desulfobacterales bacterium]